LKLAGKSLHPQVAADQETFTFASKVDRASIFVRKWLAPCGIRPRATVQITHGIAELSGRYGRLARFLTAQGCIVYAIDLRGHGQTAGLANLGQAGLTAWEDMTADIRQLSDIALTQYPNTALLPPSRCHPHPALPRSITYFGGEVTYVF
jgi:alpha-beta hydrolase superfamily lysophospholipase